MINIKRFENFKNCDSDSLKETCRIYNDIFNVREDYKIAYLSVCIYNFSNLFSFCFSETLNRNYKTLKEFCELELSISKRTQERLIKIYDRFVVYNKTLKIYELKEFIKGYSISKIFELLKYTDDEIKAFSVSMSVKDIRNFNKKEEKKTTVVATTNFSIKSLLEFLNKSKVTLYKKDYVSVNEIKKFLGVDYE